MNSEQTVNNALVKYFLDVFVSLGLDRQELLETAALDEKELNMLDLRTHRDKFVKLINTGNARLGDPAIGLHIGENLDLDRLGIFGQLILNSRDVMEALIQFSRYNNLLSGNTDVKLIEQDDRVIISDRPRQFFNRGAETTFAAIITLPPRVCHQKINPLVVRFQHKEPSYVQEYKRIFNCPVKFNQPENQLELDRESLNVKIPTHNQYLAEIIRSHADFLLQQVDRAKRFQDEVKKVIIQNLHTGLVDIKMVSNQLGASRWTVYRKLKSENISFQELLNMVQKDLTLSYLRAREHPIHEIAALVGFSSPSTFHRAFKKWTGQSPKEYQKHIQIS